jgi:hypothetical protein
MCVSGQHDALHRSIEDIQAEVQGIVLAGHAHKIR